MTKFLALSLMIGLALGGIGMHALGPILLTPSVAVTDAEKPPNYSETVSGKGVLSNAGSVSVVLSDGRVVSPLRFKSGPSGWEAEVEAGLWVKGGPQ